MDNLKYTLNNLRYSQSKYYNGLNSKFNAEKYVSEKVEIINNYFKNHNLDSCVIGISGGIDSAVAYYLFNRTMSIKDSSIKKIVPLLMPILGDGTTSQIQATSYGKLLVNINENNIYSLTDVFETYKNVNRNNLSSWTNGQLASLIRTPFLYFKAAELQEFGYKSLVVGTTNLSEGGYIGFYGKASDFMVDVQPIMDIYKSEVIEVAKYLNVPQEIINRTPQGDVHDNKNDEEMIGAEYWVLELYMRMRYAFKNKSENTNDFNTFIEKEYFKNLESSEIEYFIDAQKNIEALNKKNSHKYIVGSPAVHLNCIKQW